MAVLQPSFGKFRTAATSEAGGYGVPKRSQIRGSLKHWAQSPEAIHRQGRPGNPLGARHNRHLLPATAAALHQGQSLLICESLKELSNLEEQLGVIYTNYADSPLVRVLSDEFSSLVLNTKNFKKIFEKFNAQKQSHKEELLEIIYFFETKEADRLRNATPVVRYQNPNSWVQASFKTAPSVPA